VDVQRHKPPSNSCQPVSPNHNYILRLDGCITKVQIPKFLLSPLPYALSQCAYYSCLAKVGFFAPSSASRRLNLHQAIVSAIESDPVQDDKRKILAHVMSNGGALGFADICQLYKKKTGRALGVRNVIFDSGPDEYTFGSSFYFLSQTFPKGLLWYPTAAIMWVVSVVLRRTMYGPGPRVESSRVRLNDLEYTDVGQKNGCTYIASWTVLWIGALWKHMLLKRARKVWQSL